MSTVNPLKFNDPTGHEPCPNGSSCLPNSGDVFAKESGYRLTYNQLRDVNKSANVHVGPIINSVEVAVAVYDLSEKTGGVHRISELLPHGVTIKSGSFEEGTYGETQRNGQSIALDFDCKCSTAFRKGVIVHELAHAIDYQGVEDSFWGISLSGQLPKDVHDVPTFIGEQLSGTEEHFATVVTSWVYGKSSEGGGIYGSDWHATPRQIEWLNGNMRRE